MNMQLSPRQQRTPKSLLFTFGFRTLNTREIRKVRFVANFEYVPQVLTPICPYHQKEKAPKIISIIYQN